MDEAIASRYWCHMCSQMVNPIMEMEIKCPFCQSGFIEEMNNGTRDGPAPDTDSDFGSGSDRALSLWAPILLGMMGNPRRRRRFRHADFDDENDEDENHGDNEDPHRGLDAELESIIRRRRRSSATILQLLQGIRAGMASESENSENNRDGDRDRDRDRERERVILINPLNQTIIVQGSYDSSEGGENRNARSVGSFGDYFIGPGLDLLLQHLAENDPNRYGTPPAQKEAVEALPAVKIQENLQCSVCLDDLEIGTEAKEMPCKHKFHSACILPWLELHSSCPVCRYQLPADESKLDSERSRSSSTNQTNQRESENNARENVEESQVDGRSGNGRRFSIPWPFAGLFSSSNSNSSSTSSSSPSGSPSQGNEN